MKLWRKRHHRDAVVYEYSNLIGCGYATEVSTAAEDVNSTVGAKSSRVLVRRTETWHDTAKSEFRHRGQTQESSRNFATVDAERIAGQLSDSKQLAVENRRCYRDCEWSSIWSVVALDNQANGRSEFHGANSRDEEIRSTRTNSSGNGEQTRRDEGRTINLTFCRESSIQGYEDEYPRQSEPFIDNESNLHRSGESYSFTNFTKTVRNKTIILKRRNELNHSTWGGSIKSISYR